MNLRMLFRGSEKNPIRPYVVAFFLIAACAVAQYIGQDMFGRRAPLGLLYLPIMLSAAVAGFRPALFTSGLSLLIAPLLLEPELSFEVNLPSERGAFGLFALVCFFSCAAGFLVSLQESEETLRALLESSNQAVLGIGRDDKIRFASESVRALFNYVPGEIVGQSFEVLVMNGLRQLRGDGLNNLFNAALPGPIEHLQELQCRKKDGTLFPAEASLFIADVPSGRLAVSYIADTSERLETERKMLHAARHDPLTGLPNRALIYELGTHLLQSAKRHGNGLAILFFDLDRFKPINDTYGHTIGDKLLQQVALRLKQGLRSNDMVGRVGGDEFVAVLCDLHAEDAVLHTASHLLRTLSETYRIDTLELKTSPGIGISIYPNDGQDLDTLIRHADAAMYHAKNAGRNTYQFFTHDIYLQAKQTYEVEQRLRNSTIEQDFELLYQPYIDLVSRRFVGVETLLRWRPAGQGIVPPERFIAAAERIGMINPLTDWVLEEACRQHQKWRHLGLPALRMAVNVSPIQFRVKNFATRTADIIKRSGINPACLELEVTESTVMSDVEEAAKMLAQFKRDGVSIALDDFGTGYSSLSYLSQLPINKLKIDKSFIMNIDTDANSLAIAGTIIALGKKLGMTVIAEGIESQAALSILVGIGCELGQGYFISKPLRSEQLVEWYYQANYKHLFA